MRDKEPISVLTAIIIAIASLACFVCVVVVQRLESLQAELAANGGGSPGDVAGWQTYENDQYGFELEYPPAWTVSTDGLADIGAGATPFVAFGNPFEGTSTYTMQVFIENNTSSLSSGEYAHGAIAAARASSGPSSPTLLQFDKAYVLTVGGASGGQQYPAYELYNVFEFDHNAERIYVTHGDEALRFDFPVAQENPNISLPVANNAVAHEIMNTLVFAE